MEDYSTVALYDTDIFKSYCENAIKETEELYRLYNLKKGPTFIQEEFDV